MDFQHLRRSWEVLAETDPLWAIVTAPGKNANRWDPDEFFELGRREVQDVFASLERHGLDPPRGRALDFGCGVGRLTRFFTDQFATVVGVDLSSRMVELAREYAPATGAPIYVHNPREDLALFGDGSFDFVFSTLVLQHMRPDYAMAYVEEFIRLVSPAGVVMFALTNRKPENEPCAAPVPAEPSPRLSARAHAAAAVRRVERTLRDAAVRWGTAGTAPGQHGRDDFVATMEMYAVPVDEVVRTVVAAGGVVPAVDDIPFVPGYEAKMYFATKELSP